MRLQKTKAANRITYTYCFDDGTKQVLRPGENGVTEIDIKKLHALDDSEVYYNIKNTRPPVSDAEKQERAEWIEKFKADFIAAHGYAPSEDYIRAAVAEKYQKNWNLSLNQYESDDDGTDTSDRHLEFADPSTVPGSDDVPEYIDRLYEIVATLSPQRQAIFQMVLIEGKTNVYAAEKLGISEGQVRKDIKKIKQIISEDEIMKKFFHNGTN